MVTSRFTIADCPPPRRGKDGRYVHAGIKGCSGTFGRAPWGWAISVAGGAGFLVMMFAGVGIPVIVGIPLIIAYRCRSRGGAEHEAVPGMRHR